MGDQELERAWVERRDGRAVPRGVFLREVAGQHPDVLASFAQRWQHDGEHVQPVVQIFAKLAFRDRLHRIAVGRRQHPHVRFDHIATAHATEPLLLQNAQQFRLKQSSISEISSGRACRGGPSRSSQSCAAPRR
jgi:hypothetical protein